ncbi:MAG: HD-GYP domain-containing protein [Gaiellaceae bacterium]
MLVELSHAVEAREASSRGHSARVTLLADAVARWVGWDTPKLADLRIGGHLHDVGKLAVPAWILSKPGPLDPGELARVRTHPVVGARLIEGSHLAEAALPYVLHHHERWDGRGYPARLTGAEIPVEARLLAVADAFDAMTSYRPYRARVSPSLALHELDRCAGTQFDPELVGAFLEVWGTGGLAAAVC